MSVLTHVATGASTTGSAATLTVTSPAGASGDILLFFMVHDDFSDGAFSPSAPPITMNTVHDGSPQLADDSLAAVFWAQEDQAGGRGFTFTWTTAEGFIAICVRYSGHNSTPIQAASAVRRALATQTPADVAAYGSMLVYLISGDVVTIADDVAAPPDGFVERAAVSGNGVALYIADKIHNNVADYPFASDNGDVGAHYPDTGAGPFGSQGTVGLTFAVVADTTTRQIAGITKDNAGDALPSVEVALFREDGASPPGYVFVDKQTSDGVTGAYSFDVVEDNVAAFMVYGNLQGAPDVMDATTNELAPV